MKRGQALIEYAVILPFALLIVLMPAFQIGRLMLVRAQLLHVAQEAAIVGAREDCDAALEAVPLLLAREPAEAECDVDEDLVSVRLLDPVPSISPVVPLPSSVEVFGRAVTP